MRLELSQLFVLRLVEAEQHPGPFDHDWAADQVRVLHHQIDRFLFRLWERALLEDRAPRADEVEKPLRVDVLLEKLPRGRLLVDVDFLNVDAVRIQKTSGVLARSSGGFRVKGRFRHPRRIMEIVHC